MTDWRAVPIGFLVGVVAVDSAIGGAVGGLFNK